MSSITDFATTYIKDDDYYINNIKGKAGFRDVSRHIDTRKTKKALGIKGAGKLKVFITTTDGELDERANPSITYRYGVTALPSHPLGRDSDWGFIATCPQGTAYVIPPTTKTTKTKTTKTKTTTEAERTTESTEPLPLVPLVQEPEATQTYEFIPEVWGLIKEYAIQQYVEPIKIGDRFIRYQTTDSLAPYINGVRQPSRRTLNKYRTDSVELCERVQDEVWTLQHQQESNLPVLKVAHYRVLQTLQIKGKKSVISRLDKRTEGVFKTEVMWWVARGVEGYETPPTPWSDLGGVVRMPDVCYWDKPNEKTKDFIHTTPHWYPTFNPEQPDQWFKTKATKLHRAMFPEIANI